MAEATMGQSMAWAHTRTHTHTHTHTHARARTHARERTTRTRTELVVVDPNQTRGVGAARVDRVAVFIRHALLIRHAYSAIGFKFTSNARGKCPNSRNRMD